MCVCVCFNRPFRPNEDKYNFFYVPILFKFSSAVTYFYFKTGEALLDYVDEYLVSARDKHVNMINNIYKSVK